MFNNVFFFYSPSNALQDSRSPSMSALQPEYTQDSQFIEAVEVLRKFSTESISQSSENIIKDDQLGTKPNLNFGKMSQYLLIEKSYGDGLSSGESNPLSSKSTSAQNNLSLTRNTSSCSLGSENGQASCSTISECQLGQLQDLLKKVEQASSKPQSFPSQPNKKLSGDTISRSQLRDIGPTDSVFDEKDERSLRTDCLDQIKSGDSGATALVNDEESSAQAVPMRSTGAIPKTRSNLKASRVHRTRSQVNIPVADLITRSRTISSMPAPILEYSQDSSSSSGLDEIYKKASWTRGMIRKMDFLDKNYPSSDSTV